LNGYYELAGRPQPQDPKLLPVTFTHFVPVSSIAEDTTLTAVSSAVSTDLEGEAVILDTATGEYYGLNEVGAHIWTLLQEPLTFTELVDALLEEYDVDRSRCETEVEELLRQMMERSLLEPAPTDSPCAE